MLQEGFNIGRRIKVSSYQLFIVDSRKFEYMMMAVIFLNSLVLAIFDYKDRTSLTSFNKAIDMINTVCTAIFTVEALLKIIAYGLIMHRNSYLRSDWNIIDSIVVFSG